MNKAKAYTSNSAPPYCSGTVMPNSPSAPIYSYNALKNSGLASNSSTIGCKVSCATVEIYPEFARKYPSHGLANSASICLLNKL